MAFYLQETIAAFHSYYTLGKKDPELRVLGPDPLRPPGASSSAAPCKQVLANGLAVLGVSAPERMENPETRDGEDDA